jgi:hypothetical protein
MIPLPMPLYSWYSNNIGSVPFLLGGIEMANITKRGETYRIKESCGDVDGKQVVKSMTYKPKPSMSDKQIEKEVQRQAVLFEESCKQGQSQTSEPVFNKLMPNWHGLALSRPFCDDPGVPTDPDPWGWTEHTRAVR